MPTRASAGQAGALVTNVSVALLALATAQRCLELSPAGLIVCCNANQQPSERGANAGTVQQPGNSTAAPLSFCALSSARRP